MTTSSNPSKVKKTPRFPSLPAKKDGPRKKPIDKQNMKNLRNNLKVSQLKKKLKLDQVIKLKLVKVKSQAINKTRLRVMEIQLQLRRLKPLPINKLKMQQENSQRQRKKKKKLQINRLRQQMKQ